MSCFPAGCPTGLWMPPRKNARSTEAAGKSERRRSPPALIADILQMRGDLDGALRIRREEQLPVFERLGDVRSAAVTKGQIADILQMRGDLDGALRIRREEELPVYERLATCARRR